MLAAVQLWGSLILCDRGLHLFNEIRDHGMSEGREWHWMKPSRVMSQCERKRNVFIPVS